MSTHIFGAFGVGTGWLQPSNFEEFRCAGDSCEDTCCQGMVIHIDQTTFGKYQACSHPELKPKLERMVQILPAPTTSSYATMRLENARCSFHQDGLCSIQSKLGEDHLSHVCATYPRVLHAIGESRERSLGLSCPEAARLILDRRDPMTFDGWPDSSEASGRRLILSVLQNRRYSLSRRILLVGHICSKIAELEQTGDWNKLPQVVDGFTLAVQAGFFDAHLNSFKANASLQVALGFELLTERIRIDYTSPRFQTLYNRLTAALGLTKESTLALLTARYQQIYERRLVPFLELYDYILENYLVAQAFHQRLPFGSNGNAEDQFALLATTFLLARMLLIGEADQDRVPLTPTRVINVLQVLSRAVEHCSKYENYILNILRGKGINNIAGIGLLTYDLTIPRRSAARR